MLSFTPSEDRMNNVGAQLETDSGASWQQDTCTIIDAPIAVVAWRGATQKIQILSIV
jgi:hypothetical protein